MSAKWLSKEAVKKLRKYCKEKEADAGCSDYRKGAR